MRRYIIAFGLLTAIAGTIGAKQLTPQQALERLNAPATRAMTASPVLCKQIECGDKTPALYIFNNPGDRGFMVVSADDAAPALVGYTDTGNFDTSNVPPQLSWWLEEYAKKISYMREHNAPSLPPATRAATDDFAPITPLIKTKWDQESPFNQMCPKINNEPCPTGCVATALAQVMKYYNYPAKGQGSISYEVLNQPGIVGGTFTMDFANTSFDWDNMIDIYEMDQYTDAQANAVALLMKACGYASQMQYGWVASSALTNDQCYALVNYFNYDKALDYLVRWNYSYDDWVKIIYDNLSKGYPVIYGGIGPIAGGHSFICDGYSSDGYFHFNWGWGGVSDGYFLLDVLNPIDQGVGGNIGGFSFAEDAVVNIRPAQAGSRAPAASLQLLDGTLDGKISGSTLFITGDYAWLGNYTYFNEYINLGVIVESDALSAPKYQTIPDYSRLTLVPNSGFYLGTNPIPVDLGSLNLPDGTYTVTLASWDLNNAASGWTPVKTVLGYPNYVTVVKSAGSFMALGPQVKNVTISDFKVLSPIYNNSPMKVSMTIANNTDLQLSRPIGVLGYNGNNLIFQSESFMTTLNPGETVTKEVSLALDVDYSAISSQPLNIYLYLYDIDANEFYEVYPLAAQLLPNPGSPVLTGTLAIGSSKNDKGEWIVNNPANLSADLSLTLTKGYFDAPVYLFLSAAEYNGNNYLESEMSDYIEIFEGETVTHTFDMNVAPYVEDKSTYYLTPIYFYNGRMVRIIPSVPFYVDASNGVGQLTGDSYGISIRKGESADTYVVTSAAGIASVKIYSASGAMIDADVDYAPGEAVVTLHNYGVAIIVATDCTGHSATKKIIR